MIHSYSYKPEPQFRYARGDNPATTRTYGLELEVSIRNGVRHTSANALSDALDDITEGFIYCKSDGSVSDGLEMVSHPASLRAHMSTVSWKWFCKTCVKAGFRSHDADESAGLHIHVGRAQLGRNAEERDEVARKLTVLAARYWPELVRFSRRTSDRLEQWAPRPYIPGYNSNMPGEQVAEYMRTNWRCHPASHNARYTAVNLTNASTIEFRIFRGSLKRDTVIAAVQLVDNFCDYAMTHSYDEIQASSWLDVARCKAFNELDQYLIVRRLMSSDVPMSTTRRRCDFTGLDGCPENA